MRFVSWIVAARQYFFFHCCSVCMAMSMSVLFAVFSLELMPRMIPIGRWEVPFFLGNLVFGPGRVYVHTSGGDCDDQGQIALVDFFLCCIIKEDHAEGFLS
jgi:hypothetical protein